MGIGYKPVRSAEKGINFGVATLDESGDLVAGQVPPIINGDTTGNAATASKLATARTINLTGDVTGSTAFDGSANVAIAAAVANANLLDGINSSQFLRSDTADAKTAGNTRFNDSVELYFGDANDAAIFHDGNHTYLRNNTGNLFIQQRHHGGAIALQVEDPSGANRAGGTFRSDYQSLYGDGAEQMRVTSGGVQLNNIYSLNGDTMTIGGGEMGAQLASPGFSLFSERLYLGAEGGLKVISSPDNLVSWPSHHEATICDSNGNSNFPGLISADHVATGYNSGFSGSVNCNNWFRSSGSTGWLNDTHGGGIYMSDSTWVRTYNSKSFFTGTGDLRTDGKLQIDGGNLEIDHAGHTVIDNYVGHMYYRNYVHGGWHYFQAENTGGTIKACAYFSADFQRLFADGSEKLSTTPTGITVTGAVATSSSRKLKNILGVPESALEKIARINPVIYAMKDDESQTPQIGLIAEDVPDELLIAQKSGEPNERAIAYDRLGVWAVAAIKELTTRVENLEASNV